MAIEDKLLLIRRNDLLAKLSDEEYEALNIVHNVIEVPRNDHIYFDPDSLDKLYFIKEGYVKMGNVDDEGNEIVRELLQPGDVFGQLTLEPGQLQGEFAQAYKAPVSLCAFTTASFKQLLYTRPDLSVEYSKKVGRQVHRLHNRMNNLLQKDVRTRLLYFFWTLLQQRDLLAGQPVTLNNYLTHEDIARLTGTTRQTVTTLLGQLTSEGIIDIGRKNIVIKDLRLLQREIKMG